MLDIGSLLARATLIFSPPKFTLPRYHACNCISFLFGDRGPGLNYGRASDLQPKTCIPGGAAWFLNFCYPIWPFSPAPALAFCQVQDKTVQRFLFHIKAKMMDGALQNDAVQEAFQALPHITWNVDIDWCFTLSIKGIRRKPPGPQEQREIGWIYRRGACV